MNSNGKGIEITRGVDMTERQGGRRRTSAKPIERSASGRPLVRIDKDGHMIMPDGKRSLIRASQATIDQARGSIRFPGSKNWWRAQALGQAIRHAEKNRWPTNGWLIKTYTECLANTRSLAEANRRLRLVGKAADARTTAKRREQATELAKAQIRIREYEEELDGDLGA